MATSDTRLNGFLQAMQGKQPETWDREYISGYRDMLSAWIEYYDKLETQKSELIIVSE